MNVAETVRWVFEEGKRKGTFPASYYLRYAEREYDSLDNKTFPQARREAVENYLAMAEMFGMGG